jgi:hypothetical protein
VGADAGMMGKDSIYGISGEVFSRIADFEQLIYCFW